MPKPVILPDGFYEFVSEIDHRHPRTGNWDALFINEGAVSWMNDKPITYRSFLVDSCIITGMVFDYDRKRDGLDLDFRWRVDDPRSAKELVDTLVATQPPDKEPGGSPVDKTLFPGPYASDPWRHALDALISKPENYSRTWKLRFLDDMRSSLMLPTDGNILWSGMLASTAGDPVFMVIKFHSALATKGPTACFVCYLFDPNGRFIGGAILSDTYEDFRATKVGLSASKGAVLLLRDTESKGNFVVRPDGIEFNPDPAHAFSGDLIGKVLYRSD